MRSLLRAYASHACAAGAKKKKNETDGPREKETERETRKMRSDGEREKESEEGRDARTQDRLQLCSGVGVDATQRVEERLPRESLVKWKSITSTLNHLNWFRHGPKARSSLSLSLFRRVGTSNVCR